MADGPGPPRTTSTSDENSLAVRDPTAAATAARNIKHVSTACERCKSRQTSYNGEKTCSRCANLPLARVNARDPRQISVPGKSSSRPAASNTSLDIWATPPATTGTKTPSNSMALVLQPNFEVAPKPFSKHAFRFRGPTSAAFGFNLAKNSLQTLGVPTNTYNNVEVDDPLPSPAMKIDKDPLWCIDKDEAIRLTKIYEDECGSMYPFVDMESMRKHIDRLYDFMCTIAPFVLGENLANVNFLTHIDNDLLKIILASALTIEGKGQSALGSRIFEDVTKNMLETSWAGSPELNIKKLKIVLLTAIYYFQSDEEHLAWRKVGQAARLCIELGLHRWQQLRNLCQYNADYKSAIILFWCIYVLDRRWSFGCGLSFSLRESDIDPQMPEPDPSEAPYLSSMVNYARIASRAWTHISNYNILSTQKENVEYLDFQLLQWKEKVPSSLQIYHYSAANNQDRTTRRLRTVLFLRFNQMRMLIYRPVLFSPATIFQNLTYARRAVEVAKQSIQVLHHLDQTSDIYRTQQVCFNHFLYAAITVLFLALSHAKDQFAATCGKEFSMAINLVRSMSTYSYVSKRLWKSIECLESLTSELGIESVSATDISKDTMVQEDPSQPHNAPARPAGPIPADAGSSATHDMWSSDSPIGEPGLEWDDFLVSSNFWATPEPGYVGPGHAD